MIGLYRVRALDRVHGSHAHGHGATGHLLELLDVVAETGNLAFEVSAGGLFSTKEGDEGAVLLDGDAGCAVDVWWGGWWLVCAGSVEIRADGAGADGPVF